VLGFSPLATGAILVPLGVAGFAAGAATGFVVARVGARTTTGLALGIQAIGASALILIDGSRDILLLCSGMAMFGTGHFAATVAFTIRATSGVTDAYQGAVAGALSTAQQVGAGLGLTVTVAAMSSVIVEREATAATTLNVVEARWGMATVAILSLIGALTALLPDAPRRPPGRGS
jgi:predicted MFS family arabinose efflux permease